MIKSCVVVTLICAGVLPAHAQSSITLYGIVDASLQYVNNIAVAQGIGSVGKPISYVNESRTGFYSGGMWPSRWGIKGNEDLGDGLSAVFQLENGFSVATGAYSSAGVEFNRQAFVGISSNRYGAFTMGRQYDAISDLLYVYGPANYTGGSGTYAGDVSNFDLNIRVNDSVKYKTPTYMGLTGEVLYGFGNAPGSLNSGSTFSTGATYATGSVTAGVAYLRMDNSTSNSNTWSSSADSLFTSTVNPGYVSARTVQILDAVVNYHSGAWFMGANYGYTQYRPSSVSQFTQSEAFSSAGAGIKYMVRPALSIAGAYAYTRGQSVNGSAASPQYQSVSVRTTYSLSRATILYALAGYSHATGSTLDKYENIVPATATIGDSSNYGSPSASGNQTLVRVGMYHLF